MRIRLAKFHPIEEFEDLLGIRPPPRDATGGTIRTWRLAPGRYPQAYGVRPGGKRGVVSIQWSPRQPTIPETSLPGLARGGVAIFASGLTLLEPQGWRYFAPPGGDPLLLAGALFDGAASLVVRASTGFPAVLPERFAPTWISGPSAMRPLLDSLPPTDPGWFRSTLIANPDRALLDNREIVLPLLADASAAPARGGSAGSEPGLR